MAPIDPVVLLIIAVAASLLGILSTLDQRIGNAR